MVYERRIDSLEGVLKEAASMDADAGLRVLGRCDGQDCYLFVTKLGNHFTAMVYERKHGRRCGPGKRKAAKELEGIKGLSVLLRQVAKGRVRAFAY